jgi:hypothetical protein
MGCCGLEREKFEGKKVSILLALVGVLLWMVALAGALTHPDPSDVDVCISTAYLFGGLAKDRICRTLSARLTD